LLEQRRERGIRAADTKEQAEQEGLSVRAFRDEDELGTEGGAAEAVLGRGVHLDALDGRAVTVHDERQLVADERDELAVAACGEGGSRQFDCDARTDLRGCAAEGVEG